MNPRSQEYKFEVFFRSKFTRICLTCLFLLLTPRPNCVAAAAWENISQGDCAVSTSDAIIMTPVL